MFYNTRLCSTVTYDIFLKIIRHSVDMDSICNLYYY